MEMIRNKRIRHLRLYCIHLRGMMLIIDDQTVTVKCRTTIKPLFLYFNYSPVTKVRFLKI